MVDAWIVASMVAVVSGVVGFFVVLRGAAFPAHAIPKGAFAGAALAALVGFSSLLGLGLFAVGAALAIGVLGRRGRHDVVTALALVTMLALGAVFLGRTDQYSAELYALLFGEVLGVSTTQLVPVSAVAVATVAATALLYRPLLLSSVLPDMGEARGVRARRLDVAFLVIVALATAVTVPVVGALLVFSLMIGPPAAAQALTPRPAPAAALSGALALVTVWSAIALSYLTDWPIGFFVGLVSALCYGAGRLWSAFSWPRRAAT